MSSVDLFGDTLPPTIQAIGANASILHGFARDSSEMLLNALRDVIKTAPFRNMETPQGHTMSVRMSNCGDKGWVASREGYGYSTVDPLSQNEWPRMPEAFKDLAIKAASMAGFDGFAPNACLINSYRVGDKLSLHQDKDEGRFDQPIVSVSLGIDAVFQFGGMTRNEKPSKFILQHGDVVVWGGEDRLRFHGILPLKEGSHDRLGSRRINLTFRSASV
jgi:alkylated DNA repair protein (DNA oxidative demethylase)